MYIFSVKPKEQDEERDSFHLEDMPSPLSLPISATTTSGICHHPTGTGSSSSIQVHRPIPMLSRVGGQHPRLQALQASSGQCSLPISSCSGNTDSATGLLTSDMSGSGLTGNGKQGMSRSISDSTLRRAALHLNLNQSVLPSFTSLQQFKVYFFFFFKRRKIQGEIIRKSNHIKWKINQRNFCERSNMYREYTFTAA